MLNAKQTPATWQEVRLDSLFKLSSGSTKPDDLIAMPDHLRLYPVYGGNGVMGYSSLFNADGKNIVIGRVGANCGCVHYVEGRCWITDNALFTSQKRGQFDEHYVGYLLEYLDLAKLRGQSGQPLISQSPIHSLKPRVAPIGEQRKIAEILRTWDDAIEKAEALSAAKKRRFDAVAQKLLAPSRTIGRNIPRSNWATTTFGKVFVERQDRNSDLGPDDVVTVGKYAIRKQTEHFKRSVASKDLSNYWVISSGDFVYDPMSAYYGALGRYDGPQDGIVSPAYRVNKLSENMNSDFMVHLLRSHHIRFLLEARSSQGNKEGKRRLLQRDEFAGIEFKLPPIETQGKIAAILSDFKTDLDAMSRELAGLSRQQRGLMQKLLSGEWRVSC